MIAISFDKTVKNYIYNKIVKNPGKFFSQILKGNLNLEKADFNELLDLFFKYRPKGPIEQLEAKQMMCAFKHRAAKINNSVMPKLGGYSAWKEDVEKLIKEILHILQTTDFENGWVVAKFSTPSVNKEDTINKIDIHLIGYVETSDGKAYKEVGTPVLCGSKNNYDIAKNENFINAINTVGYSKKEKGGVAHKVFEGQEKESPDSFQTLISCYTKDKVYIYLGLDLTGQFTSVIFSNEEKFEKLADNCDITDMPTIANLISYDEGQACCPPA